MILFQNIKVFLIYSFRNVHTYQIYFLDMVTIHKREGIQIFDLIPRNTRKNRNKQINSE